jgi:hypothetical protein
MVWRRIRAVVAVTVAGCMPWTGGPDAEHQAAGVAHRLAAAVAATVGQQPVLWVGVRDEQGAWSPAASRTVGITSRSSTTSSATRRWAGRSGGGTTKNGMRALPS